MPAPDPIGRAAAVIELGEVERRAALFRKRLLRSGGVVGTERRQTVEERVEVLDARACEIVDDLWPLPSGAKAQVDAAESSEIGG